MAGVGNIVQLTPQCRYKNDSCVFIFAAQVEDSERKLRGVPNLPAAFNQELSLRLTGIRQQINAVTTAGRTSRFSAP